MPDLAPWKRGAAPAAVAGIEAVPRLEVVGHSYAYGALRAAGGNYVQLTNRASRVAARHIGAVEDNYAISGAVACRDEQVNMTGANDPNGGYATVMQNLIRAPLPPSTLQRVPQNARLVWFGINDAKFAAITKATWINVMRAIICRARAQAVLEDDDPAITLTGTWTKFPDRFIASGQGVSVGVTGSTATLSTPASFLGGDVVFHTIYGNDGVNTYGALYTITVDGQNVGTLDTRTTPPGEAENLPAVYRVANLSAGAHTIKITVGATTSGGAYLDCFTVTSRSPIVAVANLTKLPAAGYVALGGDTLVTDARVDDWNAALAALVAEFNDPRVALVDTDTIINKNLALLQDDLVHPNEIGHAKLAAGIASAIITAQLAA